MEAQLPILTLIIKNIVRYSRHFIEKIMNSHRNWSTKNGTALKSGFEYKKYILHLILMTRYNGCRQLMRIDLISPLILKPIR